MLAVDVGGTSMKGAVVDAAGRILLAGSRDTARGTGEAAVAGVLDYAADLAKWTVERTGQAPAAAGLVVPGVVQDGIARYATNLGWRDVPLRDLAGARLGMPVALGHDVRSAALAEGRFGAARGVVDFLFLPIGTGIAGGLFVRGEPYAGATGRGGELGHAPVEAALAAVTAAAGGGGLGGDAAGGGVAGGTAGERCECGQRGCLEAYASAAAVARRYRERGGRPGLTTPEILALAAAGDPIAVGVWGEAVAALAVALAWYTMVLDPALVVLGGGLAEAGATLLDPLRGQLAARLSWREPPPLARSALGPAAGRLGAALLAWREVGQELGESGRNAGTGLDGAADRAGGPKGSGGTGAASGVGGSRAGQRPG